MKKLVILTEDMDKMLIVIDAIRKFIGEEIRFIEVTEGENY